MIETLIPVAQAIDVTMGVTDVPHTFLISNPAGSLSDDADGTNWTSSCYVATGANYHYSSGGVDFPVLAADHDPKYLHFQIRAKALFTPPKANTYLRIELCKTGVSAFFDYYEYQYRTDSTDYQIGPLLKATATSYEWFDFMFGGNNSQTDITSDPVNPDAEWLSIFSGGNLWDALKNTGLTLRICSYTQSETGPPAVDMVQVAEVRVVLLSDAPEPSISGQNDYTRQVFQ